MNFDATGNKLDVEKVLADFQSNYIGREYQFFKAIGIDLINKPQVVRSILTSPTDKGMGRIEDWIRKLDNLKEGKFEIRSIRDIVIDRKAMINGEKKNLPNLDTIYKKLQTLHLQYSDDRSDFMALRPDNNAQYEFSRNSSVTVQLQGLNDLRYKSYGDMINNPIYSHYDMRRNPFIEDLYIMNTLFDLKTDGSRRMDAFGYRTAQIDISNLAGTSFLTNGIGDGLANIDLDDYSKLLQDIHITIMNGVAEGPRAAGKPNTLLITNTGRDFYNSLAKTPGAPYLPQDKNPAIKTNIAPLQQPPTQTPNTLLAKRGAEDKALFDKLKDILNKESSEKPGLWANVHAKKARGEKAAKPGDEAYPDKKQWDKLSKTSAADPSQTILITGHSGAGKSTLVKIISGLVPIDVGTIKFEGNDRTFAHIREIQNSGVALIHQEPRLFPDLSVLENVCVDYQVRDGKNKRFNWKKAEEETKREI
jgi:ABC-type multidrug transport system fused ATPase/permease subunit